MDGFSILLTSVNDVKVFVDAANRLACDVDVLAGRYIVNGKSIMGLFSIDLAQPVQVLVHGGREVEEALKADLKPYLVE